MVTLFEVELRGRRQLGAEMWFLDEVDEVRKLQKVLPKKKLEHVCRSPVHGRMLEMDFEKGKLK